MKSKDYEILVDKLKDEIERNRNLIETIQQKGKKSELAEIAYKYIKYHEEIIKFIEKIDNEI